ncbi:MAG: dihydrolipoamide acetyltransferase family protein [Aggregatilineales bacterium]
MPIDIVMPNLGFDTQTGRLIEWLKQPGDPVSKGEPIAIVESDKANVELESIASGVLIEQIYPADTEVSVGAVIARIGAADEVKVGASAAIEQSSAPERAPAPESASRPGIVEISPVARRLALEHGLDLTRVTGSGPAGKIMRSDVEALINRGAGMTISREVLALPKVRKAAREAGIDLSRVPPTGAHGQVTMVDLLTFQRAAAQGQPPVAVESKPSLEPALAEQPDDDGRVEVPLTRARRVIGERLGQSMREAPHFYVAGEFDLEGALAKLAALQPPGPRINDLLQYLTVQTLLRVPELNATYEDGRLFRHRHINLGVAVAVDDSLITPVIAQAEQYSLHGLAAQSKALIARTRENRLRPEDLAGGTFTISNLGVIGQVERFTAVINPPQVAILAVGATKQRPIVIDGGLYIRHTVFLTLSGDHRAVDGMHLGRFMAAFQEALDRFQQGL